MIRLKPLSNSLQGVIHAPGDKSISHRAIILASLAKGVTRIENFLVSEDTNRTLKSFQDLGVKIDFDHKDILVHGKNLLLEEAKNPLYFGNSGTTARLMLGVLSGQNFFTRVHGDEFLSNRPMMRVVKPLRLMGADIKGREGGRLLPLSIEGKTLRPIKYKMPVKSAQVKSALLLAALYAEGESKIIEKGRTRDHTENMLKSFGANLKVVDNEISLKGGELKACHIHVPGDISSAAFLIVAALIVPDSSIIIKNVNLNKTRTGILKLLDQMGASYKILNQSIVNFEPIGHIHIKYQRLQGTTIEGDLIPLLIDELPIIALLASQSQGKTLIRNAEELRVKETDRIKATVETLKNLGANIKETPDGMIIKGRSTLMGGRVKSYQDHRIAMMAIIASLICQKDVYIDEIKSINISYPDFMRDLKELAKQ